MNLLRTLAFSATFALAQSLSLHPPSSQHFLMWHAIGPILSPHFTVIAPYQHGARMSTITPGGQKDGD
ncbi:hypothetical protein [Paracoccus ravus]|uniref:hypothetical protein n=1 Tax=Paracoccus ravus TaxID=2447760 RepID=UPI00106EA2B8|nr:hypothetical protein [Paracoccus ravus]